MSSGKSVHLSGPPTASMPAQGLLPKLRKPVPFQLSRETGGVADIAPADLPVGKLRGPCGEFGAPSWNGTRQ